MHGTTLNENKRQQIWKGERRGGVCEGVLREGEKGRGNDMIVVSINTCDYL